MDGSRFQKLFSLSGVIPLGAFVLLHLWTAAALLTSHATYDRQVSAFSGGPIIGFLEVVLILVPMLFHAGYGIVLAVRPRPAKHAYDSGLMLSLERISGIIVLVFVVAHVWETRVQAWNGHLLVGSYSTRLVADLSTLSGGIPWIALGYLVGLAATVFHLVNGLTSFCRTWGIARAPAALERARLFIRIAGIAVFAVGAATTVEVASGARLFPAEQPGAAGLCGSSAPAPSALPSGHP